MSATLSEYVNKVIVESGESMESVMQTLVFVDKMNVTCDKLRDIVDGQIRIKGAVGFDKLISSMAWKVTIDSLSVPDWVVC